jgi:hypothetical protein
MQLLQSGVSLIADRMPKKIGPRTHAIIDYAMAATFFTAGALFWRHHRRAAVSSLLCGAATAANALLTDYPGGVFKQISFETHGKIDAGLAGLTATIPSALFFRDDAEARLFLAAGLAESAVTALSDFSSESDYGRRYIRRSA